ncbi:MAG: PAS domain S-box protein [Syntrophorhabdaceae bacterium]|nr:PAS domain S-box protein [Syntrophorhabdaceae bacterium]
MKDPSREGQEQRQEISASRQKTEEFERSEKEYLCNGEALRKSEALLKTYLENAPDGIYMTDMEGNFLYGNRKSEEITGYSRDELIGKNFLELNLLSERSLTRAAELFRVSIEGKSTGPDEFELINKEGHLVPVEINTIVIARMDQRVILGFVRDLTERKRAEEALRENENKFRTLFDTANDSILIIRDYLIVDCNNKTLDVFRCSKQDIIKRSPVDFSPEIQPDGRASSKKGIGKMRMAVKGAPQFFEWKHTRMDGTLFDTEVSLNSVELGGDIYLQAIVRDITERKRSEEALRESETKYRSIFENAVEGMFQTTPEGRFLSVNPSYVKMFGYSSPEEFLTGAIGVDTHIYADEADRARFRELMDKRGVAQGFEFQATKKDGTPIWISVNARAAKDATGTILYYEGTTDDITLLKQAEQAAIESEERYRRLFDLGADAIFLVDNETYRILEANNASSSLYGYSKEELLRIRITDLSVEPELTRDVICKEVIAVPLRYQKKKDGTVFPVEITITYLMWNGRRSHLAAIRDITQRKKAEEELERQRMHLRFVIDTVPNYIFAKDMDGIFLLANKAVADVFGVDTEDVIGKTDLDYGASEEQRTIYNVADRAVIEKGEPLFIPEEQIMRKDGTLGWFQTTKIPYRHLDNDRPAILGVSVDITDRKRVEEEILHEREKLQTLSDSAPFGLVLIDRDGRFSYINTKFTRLFGYDLSDVPDGRAWFRKAYPDTERRHTVIAAWVEDFRDARPGERKPRVFTVTCRDGTRKIVEFISSVLASGDYLMTCEDLTELRKLESQLRQAQKIESIGTLAGGIAHDFNNILTALIGYASLMQMKMGKDSPLRPYVDQILTASKKATDLTQGLLAFSRQQSVTLVPMDMNEAIGTTEQLLKRLLTEDIELRTSLTQDDTVVMADKSQMDQVLFNLVTNARDAMPKGGTLTIGTDIAGMDSRFVDIHGFGEPGRYVLMNISDTGEGMDEATRGKIFDPFFTTKETGKGTGLGLATVYGIIKQHNGYITVYSEPDRGTTFRIYLPAAMTGVDEKHDTAMPVTGGKETILIAEDDEEVRHIMRDVLQEYGYRTIEAVDGEDAIERFRLNRDVDLVIVDSVMPKKNGREAYEEMRMIDPRVKALFTSGYTKDVVLDKGIKDREFDFIAKPLSLDRFLRKVREVLDRTGE